MSVTITVNQQEIFPNFFDLGEIQNIRETEEHCCFYLIK